MSSNLDSLRSIIQTELKSSVGPIIDVVNITQEKKRGVEVVTVQAEIEKEGKKVPVTVRTGDIRVLEYIKTTRGDSQVKEWLKEIHGVFSQFQDNTKLTLEIHRGNDSIQITTSEISGEKLTKSYQYGSQQYLLDGAADPENLKATQRSLDGKILRREGREGGHQLKPTNVIVGEIESLKKRKEEVNKDHEIAKAARAILQEGDLLEEKAATLEGIREKSSLKEYLLLAAASNIKDLDLSGITPKEIGSLPFEDSSFTQDKLGGIDLTHIRNHLESIDFSKFIQGRKGLPQEELSLRFAILIQRLFPDRASSEEIKRLKLKKLTQEERVLLFQSLKNKRLDHSVVEEFQRLYPKEFSIAARPPSKDLNVPTEVYDDQNQMQEKMDEFIDLLKKGCFIKLNDNSLEAGNHLSQKAIDYLMRYLFVAQYGDPSIRILEKTFEIISLLQNHKRSI